MIRFHAEPRKPWEPIRLRVSSRRIPRGFVVQSRSSTCIRTGDGRLECSVTWVPIHRWTPISISGFRGEYYNSLEEAVEALLTRHDLRGS